MRFHAGSRGRHNCISILQSNFALKDPDKLIIVLDRENREPCPPELAQEALRIIRGALESQGSACEICVVVSNRQFECLLFADFELIDQMEVFQEKVSVGLQGTTENKRLRSIIKRCLKPGSKYDKKIHGKAIAKRIRLHEPAVLGRSRSLRKLVEDLSGPS